MEKSNEKMCYFSNFHEKKFQKVPSENNCPMGENFPNLIILTPKPKQKKNAIERLPLWEK
jgi:hypothetical protein